MHQNQIRLFSSITSSMPVKHLQVMEESVCRGRHDIQVAVCLQPEYLHNRIKDLPVLRCDAANGFDLFVLFQLQHQRGPF